MRNILLLGSSVALLALGIYACSDSSTAAPTTDYAATLTNVAQSIVIPANTEFTTTADAFAAAAAAFEATPNEDTLKTAQDDWRKARLSWRKLDALHFGPVADLGLADRIDYAPAAPATAVAPAAVDKVVDATTTIDAAAVGVLGGPSKGFLGLQYLLFTKSLADLTGDGAPARRRLLVQYEAAEIAATAHQLADAWTGSGNYQNLFVTAGSGSSRYVSQRAAIDDLVGGVAYALENVVGVYLANPLGRKSGGTPNAALDYMGASNSTPDDIGATIAGVNAVYAGQGLSARVQTASTAIDNRWVSVIGDCASKVAGLSRPVGSSPAPTFDTIVTSATAVVQASYDACKTAKTTWNSDVTTALGATLRPSDNDGD